LYSQRALAIAPHHKGLLGLQQQIIKASISASDRFNKQGIVKFVRQNKTGIRDGYIAPTDGGRDIYFREGFISSAVMDTLNAGSLVEVEIKQQAKGPCAQSILLLPKVDDIL
ncbi:MAG: cold shock domain-containing protein, partial [Cyanobacteria bacterium J06576_12]